MAHTPGPWTFEENDDGGMPEHGDKCRYIRAKGEYGALMGGTKYYPWTPENRDDWKLMAAAPDLLDAMKVILEGFEKGIFVRNIDRDHEPMWLLGIAVQIAALAKGQRAIAAVEHEEQADVSA